MTGSRAEAPDGDARAVDRERRDDRVQTRTVGEAGVDHRRRTVEPQTERCDDALDEVHDRVGVEAEHDGFADGRPLDVGAARTVDHHLGDGRVGEQRLERTEAGDLVRELLEQVVEADARQQRLLVAQKLGQASAERSGVVGRAEVVGALRDQAAVDALLERAVAADIVLGVGREHSAHAAVTPADPLAGRPVRVPSRCTNPAAARASGSGSRVGEDTGVDGPGDRIVSPEPGRGPGCRGPR